jgi:excisionase family DNA binding protein
VAETQGGWLTTSEAATYLRVHIETMRRWAREGAIPAAKLGNRGGFRFRQEDLDAFLKRRLTDCP